MSTTLNLPCVRFVKRVTNGALFSKYSYLSMMTQNATALESAPWRMAGTPVREVTMPVNKVTQTDAEYDEYGVMTKSPSFTAFTSDAFDAYQQGGDARAETAMMCGYAGCVAYRFNMPDSASSVPLESVSLLISRDRYCRAGVRVAVVLSNDAAPSDDWAVVRGTGSGAIVSAHTSSDVDGVASWGFLAQSGIGNLISSRAADSALVFNSTSFPALATTGKTYLWVYLSLEDYTSYWTMYNAKDPRYYSIEGGAMLVASKALFTFESAVASDGRMWTPVIDASFGGAATLTVDIEKLGNIGKSLCCSGLAITSYSEDAIAVLRNMDVVNAKAHVSYPVSNPNSEMAEASIPISDCDVIGGILRGSDVGLAVRSVSCTIFNKDSRAQSEDGEMISPTFALYKYRPFVVPSIHNEYTRLLIQHDNGIINKTTGYDALECDILLWKSNSNAFFGTWREAAVSALASDVHFFSGSAKRISGSIVGDGELTNGVRVNAEATFIQRIDMNGQSGNEMAVDLVTPVKPGDVIIMVPVVRKIDHLNFNTTLQTLSWICYTSGVYLS